MGELFGGPIKQWLNFDRLPRRRRRYRGGQLVPAADGGAAGSVDTGASGDAEMRSCLNCGAEVEQAYCTSCGQRDDDLRRPIWTFLADLGDDFLSWDSRALTTIGPLLVMPGYLTRAYVEGKRARFVPPVRLYLIASLLFFLVIGLSDHTILKFKITEKAPGGAEQADGNSVDLHAEILRKIDEAREGGAAPIEIEKLERAEKLLATAQAGADIGLDVEMFAPIGDLERDLKLPDEFLAIDPVTEDDNAGQALLKKAGRGLRIAMANPRRSNDLLNEWLPRAMFVLVPVFAFLLRLFYWGRRQYFANQLVFSLHFHTYIFLVLTFLLVAQLLWGARVSSWMFLAAVPLYLFIGLKTLSRQGWVRTFFKFWLLVSVYVVILTATVSAAVIYGLSQL